MRIIIWDYKKNWSFYSGKKKKIGFQKWALLLTEKTAGSS